MHTHAPGKRRYTDLLQWLQGLAPVYGLKIAGISPASGDASFRHYYRLPSAQGSVMAMDAPPEQEDNPAFIRITHLLQQSGLAVPQVFEHDASQGFLLVEDLGPQTYYQAVCAGLDGHSLQALYRKAIEALVRMQTAPVDGLPVYDQARLREELNVFLHWYAERHCGVTLSAPELETLEQVFATLVGHNAQGKRVFVHRDFHSPNLIIRSGADGVAEPGIIDYQDALAGPITYDIASLVMDARTSWEEDQQLDWAIRYWEQARDAGLPVSSDFAQFHEAYEWMALQRNLRILGVFARLALRDGKPQYLAHLPRVNTYVRQVARRYHAFLPLLRVLDRLDKTPVTTGLTF